MDRMSFVPGPEARQEIENANGHIFFGRAAALDYAEEFIFNGESAMHLLLFALVGACLSVGDKVDIKFGLRNPNASEEEDPTGELIGHTWATVTESNGKERLLWEVGRRTEPISEEGAVRAYNVYRSALATFKGVSQPEPVSRPQSTPSNPPRVSETAISRALSPSNLYFASGSMFYFVEISTSAPGRADYFETPFQISRPMRASEALILSALLTLAVGSPPLVFAVLQGPEGVGEIPESFGRTSYADAPDVQLEKGKVWIVG